MSTSGKSASRKRGVGRPPKLSVEQVEELVALVRANPVLSMDDTVSAFRRQTGVCLSPVTIQRYLKKAGFKHSRPPRAPRVKPANVQKPAAAPYGYGASHRDPGDSARYPCGLTDSEWGEVKHIFDPPGRTGRPEKYPRRQMLDACVYVLRSGCSWRMLPKDFPGWNAVYKTFRRWQARGLFEAMYDRLRKLWRVRQHREPDPTATVLDSQSVKTSPQGGPKGFDAAKKVKGRKRHLVTDTLGLLLAVLVTTGCIQDRDAAVPAMELAKKKVPGIKVVFVDGGYAGKQAQAVEAQHQIRVEVVRHPGNRNVGRWHQGQLPLFNLPRGFVLQKKRWVIERTNGWNLRSRRLTMDHDRNLEVSTAWIWLADARRLLRRLVADRESLCA